MRSHVAIGLLATLTISLPTSGRAQATPTWGLLLGTNGPGVMWHVSDRMALRQEVFGSHNSTDGYAYGIWSIGTALSGLVYQAQNEDLRTYFGPRLGFSYSGNSSTAHSSTFSGGVFYGARYAFSRAFAVQGEATLTYGQTNFTRALPSGTTEPAPSTRNLAVGSGIGVIYYFR